MKSSVSRICITVSAIVLWYFVTGLVASMVQVASAADRIHLGLGQYVFWSQVVILIILSTIPVVLYFRLPKALVPPDDVSSPKYQEFLETLREQLKRHPKLQGEPLDSSEDITRAMGIISLETDNVIRETAGNVFVGTAVMQNGRIDGLIVLVAQIRMVWQIAKIYNQRPSPRQMLYLYSNVSTTVFFSPSIQDVDFLGLTAPIVASVIPSLKGAIPGLQGVSSLLVNSLANGSANAFLTLRVGLVAKSYCENQIKPSSDIVRKSATLKAFKMVGEITKDNGERLAKAVWTEFSNTAKSLVPDLKNKSLWGFGKKKGEEEQAC